MNGTIEFHWIGKSWKGRSWNGDEWISWKGFFLTRREAEYFATSKQHKAIFVT